MRGVNITSWRPRPARQRAENARLREEVRRLEEDPAAIEEIARRDLGLIRPGEKLFIVKDLPAPPARSPEPPHPQPLAAANAASALPTLRSAPIFA